MFIPEPSIDSELVVGSCEQNSSRIVLKTKTTKEANKKSLGAIFYVEKSKP